MSRPLKQGLDYYPKDTNRFLDLKIKRLKKAYSCNGYALYDYILSEIYRTNGFYIVWDEALCFDVAEYWGVSEDLVTQVVGFCCQVGLFNSEMYAKKGLLTARSIQERYLQICADARRKNYDIPPYFAIPPVPPIGLTTNITQLTPEETELTPDETVVNSKTAYINPVSSKNPRINSREILEILPHGGKNGINMVQGGKCDNDAFVPNNELTQEETELTPEETELTPEESAQYVHLVHKVKYSKVKETKVSGTRVCAREGPEPIKKNQKNFSPKNLSPIQEAESLPLQDTGPPGKIYFQTLYEKNFTELNGGFKGLSVEGFARWKKFFEFVCEKKFDDLFGCQFINPVDFESLTFPEEQWEPILAEILGSGIRQEHKLFFRITQFRNYAEKRKKNGQQSPPGGHKLGTSAAQIVAAKNF